MSRVIALCFLLLAAVIGFLHIDSRPVWAPFATPAFQVDEVLDEPAVTKTKGPIKINIPAVYLDRKVLRFPSQLASSLRQDAEC